MKFSELGLSLELEQTVNQLGYTEPTPIQEQAIPQILRGRDLFGCAQTGTGKTASFILPMIDILHGARSKVRMPRSIVLEPTRELAAQVLESFEEYGKNHKLKAALLVGGESMVEQEKQLKRGVDVLIATPGRLLDLFERGQILLADVKILVIDEADRMLDMGFIPDVNRIVATLPKMRQTLLFSATLPDAIKNLAHTYLINPKEIIIAPATRTAETVTQHIVRVDDKNKQEALLKILKHQAAPGPIIIFCNRKQDISTLISFLRRRNFDAASLHGDMAQSQRNQTLEDFKTGKVMVLVASDVAARGLDIEGLSLVINFDVPTNAEDYVHRIGRTGRAKSKGLAITLVSSRDEKRLNSVEAFIQQEIPIMTLEKGNPLPASISDAPKLPTEPLAESETRIKKRRRRRKKSGETELASAHQDKVDLAHKANPAKPEKQNAPNHQRSPKQAFRQIEEREESLIGFGTEVPAFMLRIVPVKKKGL
jgi:superfamily II DNA/RNA helicase